MRLLLLLPLAVSVLSGCLASEVGDYRVDDVLLFSASCAAGVDQARATVFTDAMSAVGPDDLLVTRGGRMSQVILYCSLMRGEPLIRARSVSACQASPCRAVF